MHLGMVIEPHYCLVAYLGGLRLCHTGMRNLIYIPEGPKVLDCDDRGDLGELARKHHGWFSDGIRFPSPLTMPSLVAFPDQTLCIT